MQEAPVNGRILFTLEDQLMHSTHDWTVETLGKFLEVINALLNSGGGNVCVHADDPYLLNRFDERVDNKMQDLITDGSCFTDNFVRNFHLDKHHVIFRVKHRHRSILSTLHSNIKLSLDKGLANPTQAQIRFLVQWASKKTEKTEEEEEEEEDKPLEFNFSQGNEVVVKDDKGVFQESRSIQAKAVVVDKPQQQQQGLASAKNSGELLAERIWKVVSPYISAFCRVNEGGSVYFGVQEEKTRGKKWELATTGDYQNIFDMQLPTGYTVWKMNNNALCVAQTKDVPEKEVQTGKFVCEGITLTNEDENALKKSIEAKVKQEMLWISTSRDPLPCPVRVFMRQVTGPAGLYVIEVKIKQFHGLCFYHKQGPLSYTLSQKTQKAELISVEQWLDWIQEEHGLKRHDKFEQPDPAHPEKTTHF